MTLAAVIDTTSVFLATAGLVLMLVLLGAALYFGRKVFMGEGADERREIAQKKREMELLIHSRVEAGLMPPPATNGSGQMAQALPPTPVAKPERKKEQWEIDAEESEYIPK